MHHPLNDCTFHRLATEEHLKMKASERTTCGFWVSYLPSSNRVRTGGH